MDKPEDLERPAGTDAAGMMRNVVLCAAMLAAAGLPCSAAPPGLIVLEEFFAAPVAGQGKVTTLVFWETAFTNRFSGRKEAGWFVLEERFAFPDGAPRQTWRFREIEQGRYEGQVITEGADAMRPARPVSGSSDAGGVRLDYVGYAPGGGPRLFRFRHHLTPLPDGAAVNEVRISWWGLPVAYSRAVFRQAPSDQEP
jgi:hypothetical protein